MRKLIDCIEEIYTKGLDHVPNWCEPIITPLLMIVLVPVLTPFVVLGCICYLAKK